ncbi:hypothetical protein CTB58_003752 [Vibrio mimicus]
MKTKDAYKRMWDFQQVLLEDIRIARDWGKKEPSHFVLRTIYRTSAAYIEGTTYQLRLVCQAAAEEVPHFFTAEEIIALREVKVDLNSKGELCEKDNFQKLKPSILFLFKCFAKIHQIDFTPRTDVHKWGSLGKFIELRNGLMHPKSMSDFEINEYKNQISIEAVQWFNENLSRLYRQCEDSDSTCT